MVQAAGATGAQSLIKPNKTLDRGGVQQGHRLLTNVNIAEAVTVAL
jgi:hypothetical protein